MTVQIAQKASQMMSNEAIISGQLTAYNDRDITAFMRHWATDAQFLFWPDRLVADGADAIRNHHLKRFSQPHLHAVLLERMVLGSLVIDHELVTRTVHDQPTMAEVIGIYEVAGGMIRRAVFQSVDPV
jgi:putative hydrolase of HD superfamily